jgi:aspartate/methionine/tyrosine aminotransferase
VAPERIIVTPGASGALMLALAVLTNPGDEWLLPDPGYPSNRHLVRSFEGRPLALPVYADTRFQPTPAQVEAAWTPKHPRADGRLARQPHRHPAQPRRNRRPAALRQGASAAC